MISVTQFITKYGITSKSKSVDQVYNRSLGINTAYYEVTVTFENHSETFNFHQSEGYGTRSNSTDNNILRLLLLALGEECSYLENYQDGFDLANSLGTDPRKAEENWHLMELNAEKLQRLFGGSNETDDKSIYEELVWHTK